MEVVGRVVLVLVAIAVAVGALAIPAFIVMTVVRAERNRKRYGSGIGMLVEGRVAHGFTRVDTARWGYAMGVYGVDTEEGRAVALTIEQTSPLPSLRAIRLTHQQAHDMGQWLAWAAQGHPGAPPEGSWLWFGLPSVVFGYFGTVESESGGMSWRAHVVGLANHETPVALALRASRTLGVGAFSMPLTRMAAHHLAAALQEAAAQARPAPLDYRGHISA